MRLAPLLLGLSCLVSTAIVAAVGCSDNMSATGTGASSSSGTGGHAGSGNAGGGVTVDITALAIEPPSATLTVDQSQKKTQQFKAIGTLPGGGKQDVPATFSIDNTAPGSIDPATGLFTTSNAAGGLVHVTATYGGKTATADLTVILQPEVTDPSIPPDTASHFDPSTNTPMTGDPLSPEIVYPSNGTKFPTNIYKILFQWRDKGLDLFHLHFEGQFIDLSIYTNGAHPTCVSAGNGAGCWEATLAVWQWLASTAAGSTVKLTVEAADSAMPGVYYVGDSIDIHFSKTPVPGAIYYWSTTQAGVMRATVSDSAPSSFMTPNEVNQCVACHTLSRNGKHLGADVGGENLWVVDVTPSTPPPVIFNKPNNKTIPNAWSTFNYDATRVVSAKGGVLKLLDGATGLPIGANNGIIPLSPKFGTQPDWAPDGKHLAFAYGTVNKDRGVTGSSLAMLDQDADAFSNLTVVRQSTGTMDTYAYPMFDPSSQWLAYMHATGASDKNAAAKLFLAKAEAGASETDLVNANTIVADGVVLTGIANNMPTWAPTPMGDDTMWIAFASKRDYGLVLSASSKLGDGFQQLWVAAIDPAKLGSADPSFPAFRLPFQLLNENNHRPFWAEDALAPCGDGGTCDDGGPGDAGTDGPCKGLDEDCSTGVCCAGLLCSPNADGTAYTCSNVLN